MYLLKRRIVIKTITEQHSQWMRLHWMQSYQAELNGLNIK